VQLVEELLPLLLLDVVEFVVLVVFTDEELVLTETATLEDDLRPLFNKV